MTGSLGEVVHFLGGIASLAGEAEPTDGELLASLVGRADGSALAALVRRHAPMVWSVCRRILQNHHDAEDAFQATFLVLVRRAKSISAPERLANWLHSVAQQTALKARAVIAKRSARERQVTEIYEPGAVPPEPVNELRALIDQELSRLPERYRSVLILCDLGGKTRTEAARLLGVPEGTVAGRLVRARARLAERLSCHGLAVSAGALSMMSLNAALAGVPVPLVCSTIQLVNLFVTGRVTDPGLIPTGVVTLMEGMLRTMFQTKLKMIAVGLVVLTAVVGAGAGLFSAWSGAAESPGSKPLGHLPSKPTIALKDEEKIQGVWQMVHAEVNGRPLPANEIAGLKLSMKSNKYILFKLAPTEKDTGIDGHNKHGLPSGATALDIGTYRLDASKKPKRIDITEEAGPNKGKSNQGIYLLEDDLFIVCYNLPDQDRPTAFTSKPGSTIHLFVYKRE